MQEISVIMAVYNGGSDVIRAIKSLERQTFKDFNSIIIDDGSEDGSYDTILHYLHKSDLKWSLINSNHIGGAQALKKAYDNCNTKWIIRIDHDDEFCDSTIEALFNNRENYNIIYGNYLEVSNNHRCVISPRNLMECLACGVLYDTDCINKAGGLVCFDVGMFVEYDLNIRLVNNNANVLAINQIVYKYYRRINSMTRNHEKVADSMNKIREKWGDKWANLIRSY